MQINSSQKYNSPSFKGVEIIRRSRPNMITMAIKDTGNGEANLVRYVDANGQKTDIARSQTAARLVKLVRNLGDALRNPVEVKRMKTLSSALIREDIAPALPLAKTPSGQSVGDALGETGVDLNKVVQEGIVSVLSKKTSRQPSFNFEYLN